jgi:pimeloyl-ACP methyl ester carboxylesterase
MAENRQNQQNRQILFVQGAGAGTHDDWDARLVESLGRELGPGYEIRYPLLPGEDDPDLGRWSEAIGREIAGLDEGAIVAGHSVGAAVLVNVLARTAPERPLGALVLIAAPFVGEGGWTIDGFGETDDLGARLPAGLPVHVFHGLGDRTAPPAHADRYAAAIPQARVHRLPGRDHQLGDDLSEVATAIREVETPPAPTSKEPR